LLDSRYILCLLARSSYHILEAIIGTIRLARGTQMYYNHYIKQLSKKNEREKTMKAGRERQKNKCKIILAALLSAVFLGVTVFALGELLQRAQNYYTEKAISEVLLHDDFEPYINKDVYVENRGETDLYVRVKFDEFLQIAGTPILGTDEEDQSTWKTHLFLEDNGTDCGEETHKYFQWELSGASKVYHPGASDVKDKTFTLGQSLGGGEVAKETLPSKTPISIIEYIDNQSKYDAEVSGRWIFDIDGWAYWSKPLKPKQTTNLLLDQVEISEPINESYYYAINVILEAIDEADLGQGDFFALEDRAKQVKVKMETEEFIENMTLLAELAKAYPVSLTDQNNYTVPKETWLPFQFIREFQYNDTQWRLTGGSPDSGFQSLIRNTEPALYDYFEKLRNIPGDPSGDTQVDVKHMAAVVTASMYKTTTANPIAGLLMSERCYDELAGWAGDVQQMIIHDIHPKITNGTYGEYYNLTMEYVGKKGSFGQDDLYANIDGVNLYNAIRSGGDIAGVIKQYYQTDYKMRVEKFLGDMTQGTFVGEVKGYTSYRNAERNIAWTLYSSAGISSLPTNLTNAVADAVATYIYSLK